MNKAMQNVTEWVKGHVTVWVSILSALCLIMGIVNYVSDINHLVSYTFDENQIAGFTAESTGNAACIGGSIGEGNPATLYDVVPDVFLPEGQYKYTVTYESRGAAGSFLWPHTYEEYYNAMEQAVTNLEEGVHTNSEVYWQTINLNVTLRLNYGGTGTVRVTEFKVEQTKAGANLNLLKMVLFSAALCLAACFHSFGKKKQFAASEKMFFVGYLFLLLLAGMPAFYEQVIIGHDVVFHLARIQGIAEGLKAGQFPVRINPTFYNGYGYANSTMYGEIFLYIPALFYLIGGKISTAYNLYIVLANLLTLVLAAFSFKRIFKDEMVGFFATAMYMLAPYRIMDIYLRGAVGEYTAMAFFPLVIYGMVKILTEDTDQKSYRFSWLPLMFGMTGIVQSHILSLEMTAGVLVMGVLFSCLRAFQPKRLFAMIKAGVSTILLNLWFLVPFLDYYMTQDMKLKYITQDSYIQTTGVFWPQLFSLFPAFGIKSLDAGAGISSEMPIPLGIGMIACLFVFMGVYTSMDDKTRRYNRKGLCLFILSVICIWMSTVYFPWDSIASRLSVAKTLISSIQYVWRFLGISSALIVVVGGFALILVKQKVNLSGFWMLLTVLVTLNLVSSVYLMQQCIENTNMLRWNSVTDAEYPTSSMVSGAEYTPANASYHAVTEVFVPVVVTEVGDMDAMSLADMDFYLEDYQKNGTTLRFYVNNQSGESQTVKLPLLWYSGYSAKEPVIAESIFESEDKTVAIQIPDSYTGAVTVYFKGFWYWRLAEIGSVLTAIGLMIIYCLSNRAKQEKKNG